MSWHFWAELFHSDLFDSIFFFLIFKKWLKARKVFISSDLNPNPLGSFWLAEAVIQHGHYRGMMGSDATAQA